MRWFITLVVLGTLYYIGLHAVPLLKESNHHNNPEELGGHYQGDMVLPEGVARGAAHRPSWQRWPNGIIPYDMTSSISVNHSELIVDAMRRMENLTRVDNRSCIEFRPRTDQDEIFITIKNGSGCSAHVGYLQNYTLNRTVTLMHAPPYTCMRTGIIQHELLHVLGFFHEQSRPDRDDYVLIQWENIVNGTQFNFDKYSEDDIDTLTLPYDYGSVMHYEANAFTVNGQLTIIPTKNASATIGQRVGMSDIDVLEVQRYYGCLPIPSTTITTQTTTTTSRTSTQTTTMVSTTFMSTVTTTSMTSTQTTTMIFTTTTAPTQTTTLSSITSTSMMTTTMISASSPQTTTTPGTSSVTTAQSISSSLFPGSALAILLCAVVVWENNFRYQWSNLVAL